MQEQAVYRSRFISVKKVYTAFIRPVFAGILIACKYIVVIPLEYLIIKIFPKFVQKIQEEQNKT